MFKSDLSPDNKIPETPEECPRFKKCDASLCPLDSDSLKNGIWYPDEEICKYQEVNQLEWIKRQRKLSEKAQFGFYFTYEMLNHKFIIRNGIKGLDPNRTESQEQADLKKWFSLHPETKEQKITPEHLEQLKKGRDLKKRGVRKENDEKKYAHKRFS